jgi:hypothetical protein
MSISLDYDSIRKANKSVLPWLLIGCLQFGYIIGFVGMSFLSGLAPPDPDDVRASLSWIPLTVGILIVFSLIPSAIFGVVVRVFNRSLQRPIRKFSPYWCILLGSAHSATTCVLGAIFPADRDVAGGVARMFFMTCLIPATLAIFATKRPLVNAGDRTDDDFGSSLYQGKRPTNPVGENVSQR